MQGYNRLIIVRKDSNETISWPNMLAHTRYPISTVIHQLADPIGITYLYIELANHGYE